MKIRFNEDYLDFKKDKDYDVLETTAKGIIHKGLAKEVTTKGGKEDKSPVETKELKTDKETK